MATPKLAGSQFRFATTGYETPWWRNQIDYSRLTLLYVSYNFIQVIRTFGNALAEDLFNDVASKAVRRFPTELRANARRKLQMLDDAEILQVLAALPGNRFEKGEDLL
ncbi:MAG: hypothetical protein ACREXS_08585 [Gammaproteobacteria bacterium]